MVGLLVTKPCFFDAAQTKPPAIKNATPECDLELSCIENAALT